MTGAPTPIRKGRRKRALEVATPVRTVDYRTLRNPFPRMKIFSDDEVHAIHHDALNVLETLGLKVLLPEARAIFAKAGCKVDESDEMVWIGREAVEEALKTAPASVTLRSGNPERTVLYEPGALIFMAGAGAPHATDLERGRRPGSNRDFREFTRLIQHFDVLPILGPAIEPQDVPSHLRHYAFMDAQLTLSDKIPFTYARGTPQVEEVFEMLADFHGLSQTQFEADPWTYTIINTNSPRQIDIPMAQGLIDFARAKQMSIVTPFTLMGAMAPITVAGALTLSHTEALAAIVLTQLVRPGAPVSYGTFTSNVDMKSGAPIFGTPEHMRASVGAGQLADLVGLPWRSATGSAANLGDAQAANETQFGLWGNLLAGATVIMHAAGWLEGGLTVSYEKLITDLEVIQSVAELCVPTPADTAARAVDALTEVQPGGHFFGAAHTMQRYQTEFYAPLVHDFSNYGTWADRGGEDATQRATAVWKRILSEDARPRVDPDKVDALMAYIARKTQAGGAPPVSS
ncbi:trimethylamine methyltransferase family protein [Aestuariivita sp.]|jgi:trimethylamine--corrinoid protein Co-methyltransferase|uniref:trimethylamine methyltransferase family protein n=1 Tax=Aestuariivita sp. TaxID=1872407 RepID=UPI0021728BBF|nr:trimethylamine methyltransferase family protein [Aestuariivita sp.]MCE8008019.1 trimethylamine methyltransferase family protein [Aestuariivita sp.]